MTDPTPPDSTPPDQQRRDPQGEDPPGQGQERESYYTKPVWKRFYAFMLGPALVAAAALGIFTVISMMTSETSDPRELVRQLRTGGEHQRWQAAFALTKYLQPSVREDADGLTLETDGAYRERLEQVRIYVPELLAIYRDPEGGTPKVRRFLALAFSYLNDPRVVPALADSLSEQDGELVHYALAAIARTADGDGGENEARAPAVVESVVEASGRPDANIRSTAMFTLGVLGGDAALDRLEVALQDGDPSVRWNAAFALARNSNASGEAIIVEILDRGPIYQAAGPEAERRGDLFLNAVRSAGMLRTPKLRERLVRIAESDENLRARDVAIKLLEES